VLATLAARFVRWTRRPGLGPTAPTPDPPLASRRPPLP
jgi:hypothetical protein